MTSGGGNQGISLFMSVIPGPPPCSKRVIFSKNSKKRLTYYPYPISIINKHDADIHKKSLSQARGFKVLLPIKE
jgi:hypothetical protein